MCLVALTCMNPFKDTYSNKLTPFTRPLSPSHNYIGDSDKDHSPNNNFTFLDRLKDL